MEKKDHQTHLEINCILIVEKNSLMLGKDLSNKTVKDDNYISLLLLYYHLPCIKNVYCQLVQYMELILFCKRFSNSL